MPTGYSKATNQPNLPSLRGHSIKATKGRKRSSAKSVVRIKNGCVEVAKGKKLLANGVLTIAKFYFPADTTNEEALRRKDLIWSEWNKLLALGCNYWTNEALARLYKEGAISLGASGLKNADAIKHYDEPLNDADLKPLCDEKGMIRKECAVRAMEIDSLNAVARTDVRSAFHKQVVKQLLHDPLQTMETLKRLFGWDNQKTQQFLFNVQGNMSAIAYDASEKNKGKSVLQMLEEQETKGESNDAS